MELQVDINQLLVPISEAAPTGQDLRLDDSINSLYFQLRESRNTARQAERRQLQEAEQQFIVAGDWQKFAKQAVQVLEKQTKDFEIACWLMEAWTRCAGFQGLYNGLLLLHGLLCDYWPAIYPIEDEEGLPGKLVAFNSLNGQEAPGSLIMPIMAQPLIKGAGSERYAFWQYQQAMEVAQLPDPEKRRARIQQGAIELSVIQYAANNTPASFKQTLIEQISACLEALAALEELFTELCGNEQAPPSHHIRRALESCLQIAQLVYKNMQSQAAEPADVGATEVYQDNEKFTNEEEHEIFTDKSKGEITNRRLALLQLMKIGQYFRKNEPQSPVSYVIEKAIHWAQLPLPELLDELVMDQNTRFDLGRVTGAYSKNRISEPQFNYQENELQGDYREDYED